MDIKEKINQLVAEELAIANQKFPGFHSYHEGYAVVLEEVEELEEVTEYIVERMEGAWKDIKTKDCELYHIRNGFKTIHSEAIHAACEAIQVAAMAKKFLEMLEREE